MGLGSAAVVVLATAMPLGAAEIDLSSPKAAARSMFVALDAGDAAALRQIMQPQQEDQRAYIDAAVDMILAAKRLGDAAAKQFGASGEAFARGMVDRQDIAKVDAADVKFFGPRADMAVVTMPQQTIPMRFARGADGRWRRLLVDPLVPMDLPAQETNCRKLAAVFDEMAGEILAGKYAAASDAEQTLSQRMHNLMIGAAQRKAATQPTTRP